MIAGVRRQKIRDIVLEKKSATVTDLARQFSVTDETIRRDLKALEADGILNRSYGGAFIASGVENLVDANIRTGTYVDSKTTIAQLCRPLVQNGDTLFLDNSTTNYYVAKEIQDMRVTILTNNMMIMSLCAKHDNIHLVAMGGDYSSTEKAYYGSITVNNLETHFVDKAFISCRSLSLENGITDSTDRWTLVRKSALSHAQKTYVVADFSKFDMTSYVRLCDFDQIDGVITDKPLRKEWHESLRPYGCVVIDGSEA
ncbi:MAG: DeoR/GlpR family DNA-binding transcription regulator [Atopobiaceae bacterium]|jgi:DeoR/GlpR family transcriptional regulator of sugar metabolism|nr:DeoR/GlpR family DNA-binding transcription regulator [Atopobiaceae bacterium]MCI2172622.1 DeoR/GlpR family DNA-binding transcription regulator [Atopobiaceae bacterium]MCI2206929.1 DeoR/GlpR family DNA-binding transcription regulator [Atopobiaceae bacterium]